MNTELNIRYGSPEANLTATLEDRRILESSPDKLRLIASTIQGAQPVTAQALRQLADKKNLSLLASHGSRIFQIRRGGHV